MGTTKYHMSLSVDGALRNRLFNCFNDAETGKPLTKKKCDAELKRLQAKGVKILPMGDCEGFDPIKGCPGHPVDPMAVSQ